MTKHLASAPPGRGPTPSLEPVGYALARVARWMAIGGGLTLTAVALLTVVSILARELIGSPIPGDFELVEIGCAVSIFAFLPHCHLTRGNVIVTLFTRGAPLGLRTLLDTLAHTLFALIAATLTWRLAAGGIQLLDAEQETMVLRIPVWISVMVCVVATGFLAVACTYTGWRSARACLLGGTPIDSEDPR